MYKTPYAQNLLRQQSGTLPPDRRLAGCPLPFASLELTIRYSLLKQAATLDTLEDPDGRVLVQDAGSSSSPLPSTTILRAREGGMVMNTLSIHETSTECHACIDQALPAAYRHGGAQDLACFKGRVKFERV